MARALPLLATEVAEMFDSDCENGVTLNELDPGTRITVVTNNSTYRLDLIDGAESRATAVGGSVFPEPTEVRVEGAIGVGRRLELTSGVRRITTSKVKAVDIASATAA
jgi:hypothetical protein